MYPLLCVKASLGFPRNPAAENVHDKRAEEADTARQKVEGKLNGLLEHRRRLLDVLQASQVCTGDANKRRSKHQRN